MADEIITISVDEIHPNPLQPRGSITAESLVDLVDSIKEHGVLEPLVIAKTPAGYQIIAGERRWRASKLAGLTHVPALVKETTPRGMLEMAIVENVQRVDLNALDRAKGFERLMSEFVLSTSEIAVRIGKSVSYISNSLRLLQLPDALKDGLISGLISEGHARALGSIDDPSLMVEAYKIILRESGSVRKAEELARRMKAKSGAAPKQKTSLDTKRIVSDELDKMQADLQTAINDYTKGDDSATRKNNASVKLVRSRRETKVFIVLKGSLEDTENQLKKIYSLLTS